MNLDLTVALLMKEALVVPKSEQILAGTMSWMQHLQEYRTIGLRVPRRVGKTTLVKKIHLHVSSLLFNKHASQGMTLDSYRSTRGYKSTGIKYSCILLDEFTEVPNKVYEIVQELRSAGFIQSNLFILHLGT